MTDQQDDFAFCQSELRRLDPVRHFAGLTAPQTRRADFLAFQTFLADVAAIPKRVSEPAMGEIRLTWWRDIVAESDAKDSVGCGGTNIGPVASVLKQIQHHYALPKARLEPIIESRRFDLYNDPMPDMAHFETYAGETEALAMLLSAQILCAEGAYDLSDLCGHGAMAICLAHHLFDWPRNAERQKLFLPADAFAEHGLTQKDLLAGASEAKVTSSILALATVAEMHHQKAMEALHSLPKSVRSQLAPAFLRLAPAKLMIKKRRKQPMGLLRLANWRCYWSIWRLAASL